MISGLKKAYLSLALLEFTPIYEYTQRFSAIVNPVYFAKCGSVDIYIFSVAPGASLGGKVPFSTTEKSKMTSCGAVDTLALIQKHLTSHSPEHGNGLLLGQELV